MKHIDHLDGWRGIAILLVIVGHFKLMPPLAGHGLALDGLGVEWFFVLSGRLMAEILFVRRTEIRQFYWRRVSRILPALWLLIVAMLLATAFFPSIDVAPKDATVSLLFLSNYVMVSYSIAHTWSLAVEEHAYLLLSLVALASRHYQFNVARVLWSIGAFCCLNGAVQTWMLHQDFFHVYIHTDVRIASVFLSAAFYLQFRNEIRSVPRWLPPCAVVAGSAALSIFSVPDPIKFSIGTALLAFGLNTIDCSWWWTTRMLSVPPLTQVGVWSYSLYLWQQPMMRLADDYPRALLILATFSLAIMSFYVVERPAREFLNRMYVRRSAFKSVPRRFND